MLSAGQIFMNPGLVPWFWILVALIVLYLIKPKPQEQTIPSLMFLLQDKGRAFRNSFLRYLYRDFVFFLQLFILALLVGAACRPFLEVEKTSFIGNSVIVLDVSASMQTNDGRWEQARQAALDNLAAQNTIILIANRPIIYAKEVSRGEAEDALKTLKPLDTQTDIYASLIAAKDYAPNADSIVTLISDFRNTDSEQDWKPAARIVQASGAILKTVPVGGQARNIGITSLDVKSDKTRIGITNYLPEPTVASLKAAGLTQAVPLASGATDYVTINTPAGITEVSLDGSDDFALDDKAYIANNPDLTLRLLIITNNQKIKETPLWYALQAISDKTALDITTDVNNPPALTSINGYDAVIFTDVDKGLLVQRTIRDVQDYVKNGGAAVIMTQSDLFAIRYEELLPLNYISEGESTPVLLGSPSTITTSVEFGETQKYMRVEGKGQSLAQASDGTPLISLIPVGKGFVLYYGIQDAVSTFPFEPTYPVFWKRSLDKLTGKSTLEELNFRTGQAPLFSERPKKSPMSDYEGFLDKQGIYEFPGRTLAANLASNEESRVSTEPVEGIDEVAGSSLAEETKRKEIDTMLILAALALLYLELFIVKFRGDF